MEPLTLTLLNYPLSILASFTYEQLRKISQKIDVNPLKDLFLKAFFTSLKYHNKYHDDYYGIKAGIAKKVTLHMLRHSIATHYLNGGMDIRKIQHFLGHSSLASTQIYTHILINDQREERNRLHPQNRIKRKLI